MTTTSCSEWTNIFLRKRVPQDSVLGALLVLIYINNIPEAMYKILAHDISLFSILKSNKVSQNNSNSDFNKISE